MILNGEHCLAKHRRASKRYAFFGPLGGAEPVGAFFGPLGGVSTVVGPNETKNEPDWHIFLFFCVTRVLVYTRSPKKAYTVINGKHYCI